MTDPKDWTSAVVTRQQPMRPLPTDVKPILRRIGGIRAVVFDVYGTLLISGSGEVGTAEDPPGDASLKDPMQQVMASLGVPADVAPTHSDLRQAIAAENDARRSRQRPYPEIEIVNVWRELFRREGLISFGDDSVAGDSASRPGTGRLVRAADEFEALANPTWPMPGASEVLGQLSDRFPLGIVSNAQVFTIDLIESLCGAPLMRGPFDLDLCVFSNRFRQSKPGPRLFEFLKAMLHRRGISAGETLYVGNDRLNDVWAAGQAGLKTAWFAGDRRSLRRRVGDPRCDGKKPDVVVTALTQLLDCV